MSFWTFYLLFSLIAGSICCLVLWYYFYIVRPFSKLPSFRMDMRLWQFLFSKTKFTTNFTQTLISVGKKYQSEGLFVIWVIKPVLIIFNEEYIKNVISNNLNKAAEYKHLHEGLGIGLFTSDEVLCRKRRKMFNPAFGTNVLKVNIPLFNKHSKKLQEELSTVQSTAFIDVEALIKKFSFNIIYDALAENNDDDSFVNYEKEEILELVDQITVHVISRLLKPWLSFRVFFKEKMAYHEKLEKINELSRKQMMKAKEIILLRKSAEKVNEDGSECTTANKSFAEILFENNAKDPDFTMDDVLSEVKLFIVAGYDTISCALKWCLFLLGNHPSVQDRVYEEIMSLSEYISFEDLQNFKYTECVIMETLRLYPPALALGRQLKNETQFGKYRIPKGTSVFILTYLFHRDPKVFTEPDKFNPDRFLDDNSLKSEWRNFAFSAGFRNCIGRKFAMMEMKIALAYILRKFMIISYEQPDDSKLGWEILLTTEQPLKMKFIPRQSMFDNSIENIKKD